MRQLYSRITDWARTTLLPWLAPIALLAVALAAVLGSRRAGEAIDRRKADQDLARKLARTRAEEARRLAEAIRDAQLAEADRERAQALAAGREREAVEREHGERVAKLLAMGNDELAQEATEAADRSRKRRAQRGGTLLVTLALLGSSVARAEPVCLEREDVAQLVADSEDFGRLAPLYLRQIEHLEGESAELRRAILHSTAAAKIAIKQASEAETAAYSDRQVAEKARRRAKWWGGSGVVAGALFTLLLVWGVQ